MGGRRVEEEEAEEELAQNIQYITLRLITEINRGRILAELNNSPRDLGDKFPLRFCSSSPTTILCARKIKTKIMNQKKCSYDNETFHLYADRSRDIKIAAASSATVNCERWVR